MNSLEAVPAIRRIDTDRDDLFAIDVVGHVSPMDAENLFGLLEAAYLLHPRLDALVRLIDHDGVDWREISEDTLRQGFAGAVDHIGRCAAIGEPDWTTAALRVLPSPIELRHFDTGDQIEAWRWLAAREL
ncbi:MULTISPECIES: STAS/SEC14 domain-containing protein [unclassified Mesorhizobium]|uniref:STAS/SEC14 domain-containing protein n=1 Tax=unclassified Mesorhizobium TaxID=325217 RepID=UPI00095E6734|nr:MULTISPECIES: STAS/SEC14 domain-containing protein [unclassified Mesorhizobium]MBN9257179.1 STAS/SEC14 domain-containing protein [Mesorhizobium sp.]OJX82563.1 MAG: STAS/SEC14 domain-containing protein [Mesorhizobium sp. 65-26]